MRVFSYTSNTNLVIDIELPGTDPKDLKLAAKDRQLFLNEVFVATVGKGYDLSDSKATHKHGLLQITVPAVKPAVYTIPIVLQ